MSASFRDKMFREKLGYVHSFCEHRTRICFVFSAVH